MSKRKRRMSKKDKKFISICLIIVLLCGVLLLYYYKSDSLSNKIINKKEEKITVVDQDSRKRPLAIMYDNNVAYDNHAGLQDSFINYEIIVEGGLTRIMALFKDKDVDLIGPVRSSRHYFLDYSLESDAIYCHYGWSEFAKNDISSLGVDNINGLTNDNAYYRDNTIAKPHNVFTSTDRLYDEAKNSNYSLESDNWQLLNYSTAEIVLNSNDRDEEDSSLINVNEVSLKYSNYHTTSYQYDSTNKYYLRFMDQNRHVDKTTKEQLHYKNIIIEKVNNHTLDSYGRQDLDTTPSGSGYYITNGYALPITWEKPSRSAKTIYKYENGREITVNDGNTFIQVIPTTVEAQFN